MTKQPRFLIGTRFKTAGQHPKLCEVVDIHSTYNHTGEVVKINYVAKHALLGQSVLDYTVADATIARGIVLPDGYGTYFEEGEGYTYYQAGNGLPLCYFYYDTELMAIVGAWSEHLNAN